MTIFFHIRLMVRNTNWKQKICFSLTEERFYQQLGLNTKMENSLNFHETKNMLITTIKLMYTENHWQNAYWNFSYNKNAYANTLGRSGLMVQLNWEQWSEIKCELVICLISAGMKVNYSVFSKAGDIKLKQNTTFKLKRFFFLIHP